MKILTHLNLSQNELQNAVLQKLATAPENAVVGQIYFNTTDAQAYIFKENNSWENLGLSADLLAKLNAIEANADKVLYGTLPEANETNAGKVVIYTGEVTATHKPGLVYICTEKDGAYAWTEATPTMVGAETDSATVTVENGVISTAVRISDKKGNALGVDTDGGLFIEATEVGSATPDEDGLMTSDQAAKLDGIESGAQVNKLEGVQVNGTDLTIDANKKVNIVNATTTAAGLMSAEDKAALDAAVAKNGTQDTAISTLEGKVTALEGKDGEVATALEGINGKITALEAKDTEINGKVAANEAAIATKQDELVAGENIAIAEDGKTISASMPTASKDTAGIVKVGAGLAIDENGVLNSTFGGTADAVEWTGVLNKPSKLGTEDMAEGTYAKVTVDKYGLVTAGAALEASDIPDLSTTYINVNQKAVANGVATLDANAKINLDQIPDALLGNVKFGGTFDPATGICTLVDGKIVDNDGTEHTELTITADNAADFTGYYFLATGSATLVGIDFLVGDWCISNGTAGWAKVDNTDAVMGVKGDKENTYRIGQVNITAANVGAVEANEAITGGTFTKVTVDEKGLVTAGEAKITTADISDFATASQSFVAAAQGSEKANQVLMTDAEGNVTTVVHKYVEAIGDGTAKSINVAHNMNTTDVIVQVSNATTFEVVYANVVIKDANNIEINFAQAPASKELRVIVIA